MTSSHVIIVGAGLAGLAAAFRLAQAGQKVTVLEQRSTLGGRTSSWMDQGYTVESGLHKVLGIYRALPEILAEAGVTLDDIVTWVDAAELHAPTQQPPSGYFTAAPLHRPLATLKDAVTTDYLTWSERFRLAWLAIHGTYNAATDPQALDAISTTDFARQHRLTDTTIKKLLEPATQGVFFLPPHRYSAYGLFAPIVAGLKNGGTFRIGAFRGGMTDLMITPLAAAIKNLGGTVMTETSVTGLMVENGRVTGVTGQDTNYTADNVIIATPPAVAQNLLHPHFSQQPWARDFLSLPTVSTISIQFELAAPVFPTDHTHFSTTDLACFAEQSHTTFPDSAGRLSAILYPADQFLGDSDQDIISRALRAIDKLQLTLPDILHTTIVRHPHEFYAIKPGIEHLRPTGPTPAPGLTLAGDYIKQPFLASMEGAVISGQRAANSIISQK